MSAPSLPVRQRLSEVRYEIRGELARRARELETRGRQLIKLNIGNPGAFGFRAPEHLQRAIADHIHRTDPYTHQQGLPEAREAIAAHHVARGTPYASPERVFVGNGVSELIDISLRALLNPGDEVLVPSPDYPLWSAATILNEGRPGFYQCHAENGFLPDPVEMEALVSERTRAIVLINPNNPTGANYPRELLERIAAIADRHNLLLLCDEIYDSILYDGHQFVPVAPIAGDAPCLSFGGLSKVHRACGWRVGWAVLSGDPERSTEFRHAMDLLGALRLCANVPGQFAIAAALTGADTIGQLCGPGGRLYETRRAVIEACEASPHRTDGAGRRALCLPAWSARPPRASTTTLRACAGNRDVLIVPAPASTCSPQPLPRHPAAAAGRGARGVRAHRTRARLRAQATRVVPLKKKARPAA